MEKEMMIFAGEWAGLKVIVREVDGDRVLVAAASEADCVAWFDRDDLVEV